MTTFRRLPNATFATLAAATLAAAFTVGNAAAADRPVRIVELPHVTVVAQRAAAPAAHVVIVELPRVTVVAKRALPDDTVVAQRAPRSAAARRV